ncbi:MAG: hypothetical protein HC824_11505 [Synechococcales cyanobacterium RM1_1_8]|nr:hypothetical protein [Synechococcales cyanobacterium RM1_1_8]
MGLPGLTAASLDAQGKMMAIALPQGSIKLIDSATGAIETTLRGHGSAVRDLAFNGKGDRLLSGSDRGGLRLWDLASGDQTRTLQYESDSAQTADAIQQVTFSPEGDYIAAADDQGIVRFWASDRDSFLRLARQRSAHQLDLDRCFATVYTGGQANDCPPPEPPTSLEAAQQPGSRLAVAPLSDPWGTLTAVSKPQRRH